MTVYSHYDNIRCLGPRLQLRLFNDVLITVCHIATQADFFSFFSETALGQMNGATVTKRVPKAGVGKLFDRWVTVSLKCGRVAGAAEDEWSVLDRHVQGEM